MPFDFKKEYKEFYAPKAEPSVVDVPEANFVAVRGTGDPNDENGEFVQAFPALYTIAYMIKMSKMTGPAIPGYFDFVVPPVETLWTLEDASEEALKQKHLFKFVLLIRLPDFVTREVFDATLAQAVAKKKDVDFSKVEFLTYAEGRCVQALHVGPYDDTKETVVAMRACADAEGCVFADERNRHEIYLSDPKKTAPEKLKTILRIKINEK